MCKHATGEPATLTLLMDNTAGMHSFQKWYTKNRVAMFLLKRAYTKLKEKNIELIVKWVKSADNPSDAPSRFEEVDDDLCVKAPTRAPVCLCFRSRFLLRRGKRQHS